MQYAHEIANKNYVKQQVNEGQVINKFIISIYIQTFLQTGYLECLK